MVNGYWLIMQVSHLWNRLQIFVILSFKEQFIKLIGTIYCTVQYSISELDD